MGSPRRPSLPQIPIGWNYLCRSYQLSPGPRGYEHGGRKYAAFRDPTGKASMLDARCSHMSADLSTGCVRSGVLHCPLHDWQYAGDGRCVRIPAQQGIPPFAQQQSFPVAEFGGHLFFFNAPVADYPMPFYDGRQPGDLLAAEPFEIDVLGPWYMVGANAFDAQHFRTAHDRTLVDEPVIDHPSPFARRIVATYEVTGESMQDAIIRRLSGPRVRMSITVWGGTLVLVTAEFKRTTSYGMMLVRAIDDGHAHLTNIVWVRRRQNAIARALLDPVDAHIRRRFICEFVKDDAARTNGVRYNSATLIPADHELAQYMNWLSALTSGATPHTRST
jgi:phenylpropionate dioxygenase-like ring-hydroxylating dioxygenase large terminal subunit